MAGAVLIRNRPLTAIWLRQDRENDVAQVLPDRGFVFQM